MSRSKKDGRKRGGHVDKQCTELWSRRCPKVSGMYPSNRESKRITHRHERRGSRIQIHEEIGALNPPRATEEKE